VAHRQRAGKTPVTIEKCHVLKLPWPAGRTGKPLTNFPKPGTESKPAGLGFLYSSWFYCMVADQLNEFRNFDRKRDKFHFEVVAFQLGHEI